MNLIDKATNFNPSTSLRIPAALHGYNSFVIFSFRMIETVYSSVTIVQIED